MTWADRWRELFDAADPQVARRLVQGRMWERSGRVTQLGAAGGVLSGRVQGSKATPYAVEIRTSQLSDDEWAAVAGLLASEVRHGARLLAGHAPEGLDAELEAAGIHLFPSAADLELGCTCADEVQPCAHQAGVLEAVAAVLDDDPFLLFRLRGRGRERLLAEVSAARRRGGPPDGHGQQLALDELEPTAWAQARAPLESVPLPDVEPPTVPAAPLRVLGDPPGWAGGVSAWDLFRPLVEQAARWWGQETSSRPGGR